MGVSRSGPQAINTDRGGVMLNMKVVTWALGSWGAVTNVRVRADTGQE
jgi:hypothetical protein